MTENANERDIISITVSDLKESVRRLQQERDALSAQIAEKEKALRHWELKLEQLNGAAKGAGQRLPKGEPRRRLIKALENLGAAGATITELSGSTGMGWSTVRSTLLRHKEDFAEKDGRWHCKKS